MCLCISECVYVHLVNEETRAGLWGPLKQQVIVSLHVGARNQTRILCKIECSLIVSHLSSSCFSYFNTFIIWICPLFVCFWWGYQWILFEYSPFFRCVKFKCLSPSPYNFIEDVDIKKTGMWKYYEGMCTNPLKSQEWLPEQP